MRKEKAWQQHLIAERRLAGCKHDYKRNKSHLTIARTMAAEDNGSLRLQLASPALGRTWRGHGTAAGRPPSFGPRRGRKRANARRHSRAPPRVHQNKNTLLEDLCEYVLRGHCGQICERQGVVQKVFQHLSAATRHRPRLNRASPPLKFGEDGGLNSM